MITNKNKVGEIVSPSDKSINYKKYMQKSIIGLPTFMILLLGYILITIAFVLRLKYNYFWYCTLPFSILGAYVCFTPLHDASHGSVSLNGSINKLVGMLAALTLFYPSYEGFKLMHLRHHAYTNDPINDPDYYSNSNYILLLPFKWLTQPIYYHYYFIKLISNTIKKKYLIYRKKNTKSKFITNGFIKQQTIMNYIKSQVGIILGLMTNWILLFLFSINGYFTTMFILWVLPANIALTILAGVLDYLPHKPHTTLGKDNQYKASHMIDGIYNLNDGNSSRLLSILLLNHNYHNIHHLYPKIPFYRYHKIWNENKDELIKRGAVIDTIFH